MDDEFRPMGENELMTLRRAHHATDITPTKDLYGKMSVSERQLFRYLAYLKGRGLADSNKDGWYITDKGRAFMDGCSITSEGGHYIPSPPAPPPPTTGRWSRGKRRR